MTECKFYKVCPNGGVFTRCKSSGYAAECVPHIFDAMEDEKPEVLKILDRVIHMVGRNRLTIKQAREITGCDVEIERPKKATRVKVRKHKRERKNECRCEITKDKLSFILNGKEIAFIDEEHPFGAYVDFEPMFTRCKTLKPLPTEKE